MRFGEEQEVPAGEPGDESNTTEKESLLHPHQHDEVVVVALSPRFCRTLRIFGFSCILAIAMFVVVHRRQPTAKVDEYSHQARTPDLHQVKQLYGQGRSTKLLGTSSDYVEINTKDDTHHRRVEQMRQLDTVRNGHCGGFEQIAQLSLDYEDGSGDPTKGTNWKVNEEDVLVVYCPDGDAYKQYRKTTVEEEPSPTMCHQIIARRLVCEAPHPVLDDITVTIERIGPFLGNGGYDWTIVDEAWDVGLLQGRMNGNDWTFVGALAAPVSHNGTILSYPPIHIHHAHIFPYGDFEERGEKIIGSIGDHHDVMFQSHGDSECLEQEGGVACLLQQTRDGQGFVARNSTSGISANFELNDVRPKGSPMDYWFEVTLLHSPEPPKESKATFIGLNNPCFGDGPCTYMYPMDPHNNAMWYQYEHGIAQLEHGTMSDFILHTHQSIFDSAFLIKAPNDDVFNDLEAYREQKRLPLILDCHRNGVELEDAKAELLARIRKNNGQVVCESTKPSLVFMEDKKKEVLVRDKRAKLNCLKDPVDLKIGDRLIVLAFNTVHEKRSITWKSKAFKAQNAFSDFFAAYQHTIFRFTLTYDTPVEYAPPSFFYYSDVGEDIDDDFDPDKYSTATCPPTISFVMNNGLL